MSRQSSEEQVEVRNLKNAADPDSVLAVNVCASVGAAVTPALTHINVKQMQRHELPSLMKSVKNPQLTDQCL